jgi:AcrR family transcriptional regulator
VIHHVSHDTIGNIVRVRRDEQIVATRARILRAARDTIVAAGYHAASLEHVAAAANVTRVTVYRQYGNKRGLLEALVDDLAVRSNVVGLAAEAAALDPADSLAGLIDALGQLWALDPALMRRLIGLAAVDPEVDAVIASRERWRHDQVDAVTRRLATARRIRPPFTRTTASACIDAATAFPAWDRIAETSTASHTGLIDIVLNLLGSVLDLTPTHPR